MKKILLLSIFLVIPFFNFSQSQCSYELDGVTYDFSLSELVDSIPYIYDDGSIERLYIKE